MGRVSTVSSVSTTFELLQQKHPIRILTVELMKMTNLSKNPEHARVCIYSKTYLQKFFMSFWILLRTKSLDFSFLLIGNY